MGLSSRITSVCIISTRMILAGVYCLIRLAKTEPRHRFLGLGLLIYPATAVLTEEHLHSGRSISGVVFWGLTAAIGAHFLWQMRGFARRLLIVACGAGVVEVGLYLTDYFGPYQVRSRGVLSAPFTEALEDCFRAVGTRGTLYVSRSAVSPAVRRPVNEDFKPLIYADILFFFFEDPDHCFLDSVIKARGIRMAVNDQVFHKMLSPL